MLNIKQLFDDVYFIIAKKQTFFEFILNLTFVLIIFIILVILYWDSINRSIISNGRCKININDSDITYNLSIFSKTNDKDTNNANIINISYDNSEEHNSKIDCACPSGNIPNDFKIPVWDDADKKIKEQSKFCYCDKNYQTPITNKTNNVIGKDNIKLDGDAFLIDYYNGLLDAYDSGKTNYYPIDFNR